MDLSKETALSTARLLRQKQLGCVEVTRYYLDRIRALEPQLNAFISVQEEQALARAQEMQALIDAGGELPPLAGVPVALKDNICTKGAATTCASRMLERFVPPYSAAAAEQLAAAGTVPLGKLNMDEFAMGGSTETSCFGPAKNPWDIERVPGGSSGGPAVAVAAGEVPCALGSDTGGSIRQPCSFCGVSGIKPTYGAVSRYGLVAFASSLDQIGPIARTVEDCAALLAAISDGDARDSTSARRGPLDFSTSFCGSVGNLRVALPREYFSAGLDDEVAAPVLAAAKTLERMGATVAECSLALSDYAVPAYYVIACAEASSNLARYDGVRYGHRAEGAETLPELYLRSRGEGFGLEVKRRIMLGSFVLSSGHYDAYYQKAMQARGLVRQAFDKVLAGYDIILAPVAPTTAYRLGEQVGDPLKMYLGDRYTVAVNLAGLPAVSLPCGLGKNGLPVGMQLIGRAFEEPLLVQAAHAFQQATDFHLRRPEGGAVQ